MKEALKKANLKLKDINLISFSQSPGIGHCLRIGAMFARALSIIHKIPIIGHLEIGRLITKAKDPILLYVSGANTQVIAYEAGKYRIFGETLDIGVGNLLDAFARELGIGFPGGPKIQELASKSKKYIEIPYVVKGMDINLGGILTNALQKIGNYPKEDICFSLQETVFSMLVEVAERALAHTGKNELLLGGGVACNTRLQEMCKKMCDERNAKFFCPPNSVLVDNGAMIAWQGYLEYSAGKRMSIKDTIIKPYLRTDDIDVNWR